MNKKNANVGFLKKMITWIIAVIVIAFLLCILIICRNDLSPRGIQNRMKQFFLGGNASTEISYDGGMDCLTSALGDSLIVANSSGVDVYSRKGALLFSKSLDFKDPAIQKDGKYAVVYDVGGTSAAVLTEDAVVSSVISEHEIFAASVNTHGVVSVCAAEATYKSSVSVYNSRGEMMYKWYSAKGYTADAALAENNQDLVVAVLTKGGTELVRLNVDTTEEISRTSLPGETVIHVLWNSGGSVTAVLPDGICIIDEDGTISEKNVDCPYLSHYASGTDQTVFIGSEYEGSTSNQLFSYSNFGEELKPVELEGTITDLCLDARYIAVLCSGKILVYNTNMKCVAQYGGVEEARSVHIMKDGSVLAAGDYFAWSPERMK